MKNFVPLLALILLTSCSKDLDDVEDSCTEYELGPVGSIQAPSTAHKGEEVEVEVQFKVYNSCGKFNSFKENIEGNTRIIIVQAIYQGCECYLNISERTTTYRFTPESPGIHELRFLSEDQQEIVANILVE